LRHLIQSTGTGIDTYTTSSLFYLSKGQNREACTALEKARETLLFQQVRATAFLKEIEMEKYALSQKVVTYS